MENKETTKKFEPILLKADWGKIKGLKKKRELKKQLLKDLEKEATNLIGEILPKNYEAFFNNPLEFVTEKIKEQNPLNINIKFDKLLNLVGLDLTTFKAILNKMNKIDDVELIYKDWKVYSKVDEEKYKIYTKNEAQNKRYNSIMAVITAYEKLVHELFQDSITTTNYINDFRNFNPRLWDFIDVGESNKKLRPFHYHIEKIN